MRDFVWEGRKVFIVLDKDPSKKFKTLQDAARELYKMGAVLEFYGADVTLGTLPGKLTEKVGLDDFFVAGRTWDEIKRQSVDEFARKSPYLAKKWKTHNEKRVKLGVRASDIEHKPPTKGTKKDPKNSKAKESRAKDRRAKQDKDQGLER